MSQVITKLQSGGSLTIDGIKYKATPEFINALTAHLRETAGTDAQTLAGLSNALLNGENLKYDSAANTISGMDGSWSGITNRQNELRRAGSSRWRKWWEAQFDTDAHRFRNALSAIGSFHYQVPKETEETPTNLKDIYGDTAWFDYIDKDGTQVWSENSAKNAGLMQRLDDMTAYLSDPEAGKKIYKLASQYTPEHMSALQGLYNQRKDGWADILDQIKTRAKNNQLGEDDIKFLNNFFIAKPVATPEEIAKTEAEAKEAADKKRFADAGYDYDKWSPYIYWNDQDNYWGVNSDALETLRSNFGGNGNYWFNDLFKASQKYNPNGAFDFLNGHFIIGDRIYKQSEASDPTSALSQILRRSGGFRDLNAGMRHNEANDLIEQLWGNEMGWEAPNGQYYSDWLDPNGNIYYRSRTGDYNWTGKDGNQQLVEWVAANPELADEFGYYTPQFKLTDQYGNELNKLGPERINGLTELSLAQRYNSPFNRHKLWYSENGNSEFDGRYFLGDGYDDEGNVTGAGFWINPNDPTGDWIYESDEMKSYVPDIEGNAVRVPKEMVAILASNPDFIKRFQNDESGFRSKFAKVMAGAVGRGINFSTAMSNAGVQSWMNLGFDRDTAKKLALICNQYARNHDIFKSNRSKRRIERLVHKPELHKDGGKVEKAAYGEMVGKSSGSSATPTQTKTDKPIRDTREYTNFGKGKLQPHDYIELGAVLADAASIGLAFTPASIASGIAGVTGSTAGFAADVRRDGFQGSDLGQYAVNLGLDALSFIPVLGGATKSVKVINNLKKVAPIINKIMKAAALYGIPHAAVQSWDAIQNGNFNMRDLRAVINAIGGAVHLSRAGFKKPVRSEATVEFPKIDSKSNNVKALQLSEEMLKAIRKDGATVDSVSEAIAKELSKGAKTDAEKFTADKVKENWNIDSIFKQRNKYLLFGEKQSKAKNLKAKEKKGAIRFEDISKNPRSRRLHEAYMDNLAGNRTRSYEIQTPDRLVADINVNGVQPIYREIADIPENPNITRPKDIVTTVGKKKMPPKQVKIKKISGEKITRTKQIPIITPITSGITWERPTDPLKSPAEAIGPNNPNYSRGYIWNPVVQPVFRKKGGKIEKGQTGLRLNGPILNPDLSSGFKFKTDPLYTVPTGSTTTFTPSTPTPLSSSTTNFRVVNPMTGQPVQTTSSVGTEQGSKSEGVQDPYDNGGFSLEAGIDPTMPLNAISAAVQLGNAARQRDIGLRGGPLQYGYTWIPNPRFINTGEGDAFRNQAKQIVTKDKSSDNLQNELLARIDDQQRRELAIQGDLADSKAFSAYKSQIDQNYANNISRADQMANQNKYLFDNWKHQQKNTELGYETMKSQILDKLLYAGTQYASDNYRNYRNVLAQKDLAKEIKTNGDEYLSKIKGLDLSTDGGAQAAAGFRDTLTLQNQIANLKSQGKAGLSNYYYNKLFAKSGGKVSSEGKRSAVTYSKDPYPELLLQNAKDSTEIVKQLNDAVIKLLLQTKPINVH